MTKDEKKKLVEEISSSFYNSIRGNSKIQRIITDGAASSEEVAKLAKQLGAYLRSAVVHGFTDIELLEGEEMSELAKEILEPLMKYSHELVGKAAKDVYTAFNEENNIDINPKLPDFPKARFDQIISAAGEEGKPRETILRRISVVPETVVTNMSDQNARAAANTYSSAGFETYIQRSDGAGCCNWCSKLVGKFEYPENTPKDVFRRHDNCGCIVTYVCGNMRQNVHSRETWEQPEVKVPELTRNPDVTVPELARGLLTEGEKDDIIELYRRIQNTGSFSSLKVPMQKRFVKKVTDILQLDCKDIDIQIIRDAELVGKNLFGYTFPNGKKIQLYPDAFTDIETFVRTLGHERIHCEQIKLFGVAKDLEEIKYYEKAAYFSEEFWWELYIERGGLK